jgi:Fe-S oxidoreductase/FAD/FMN-containing dehydrogenase
MGGKTVDNTEELEVVTYDGVRMRVGRTSSEELDQIIRTGGRRGEIYSRMKSLRDRYADLIRERYPKIPRRVSGYNLDELLPENGFHVARALVGSEGTLVTVLQAKLRLVYSPPVKSLLVLGFPDVYDAAHFVPKALEYEPTGVEGLDDRLLHDMRRHNLHPDAVKLVPPGGGWLMVEFGGETRQESDEKARRLMRDLKSTKNAPSMKLFDSSIEERKLWEVREAGLGATANVPHEELTWEGWEDAAVPPDKLADYLRDFRNLLDKFGYKGDLYGHFGQGCVHTRINFDLQTHDGIQHYRAFIDQAADLVVQYGGSLSGEHGDGQSRAALLPKMFGSELIEAFREFKSIWDPEAKMNPGKVVDPYDPTENLRLGSNYRPWIPETHFKFPEDEHDFSRASLRCVGVGNCRRLEGGTMCPSFMVTREEMHSTRGRARMLFEMLQGEVVPSNWRNDDVHRALDLCLACKGCKGDCPVNVDMATYKAEFLSHYYKGHLRPASAYAMGLIYWWARIASHMPRVANFFMQTPAIGTIMKKMAGVATPRTMPRFAEHSFVSRNRDRIRSWPVATEKPLVMLWPDTFNNYFFPGVLDDALFVLESAGYEVVLPPSPLCCGRPLYDYGMLDLAEKLLRQVLGSLKEYLSNGVSIVGLEPSCVAVFRDELANMLPADKDACRMRSQTFLLSEFLAKHDYQPPLFTKKAIVHGHCHHKAIMGMDDEEEILKRMKLDYKLLDSGCCGMAGSFGFESDHYDISIKVGERVLLPAVRDAAADTLIIANGFSCREQISQCTGRTALHLAQVLRLACDEAQKSGYEYKADYRPRAPTTKEGFSAKA